MKIDGIQVGIDVNSFVRNYYFRALKNECKYDDEYVAYNKIYKYNDSIIVTEKDYIEINKLVADAQYSRTASVN